MALSPHDLSMIMGAEFKQIFIDIWFAPCGLEIAHEEGQKIFDESRENVSNNVQIKTNIGLITWAKQYVNYIGLVINMNGWVGAFRLHNIFVENIYVHMITIGNRNRNTDYLKFYARNSKCNRKMLPAFNGYIRDFAVFIITRFMFARRILLPDLADNVCRYLTCPQLYAFRQHTQ